MEEKDDITFEEHAEDGSELSADAKVKKLRDRIKELERESKEYLDGWQRARADYANLQKLVEEDRKRMKGMIEESFIEELLPVVDSFGMAMANKEAWEKVEPAWRTGVEYIHGQLMGVLREHKLEPFGTVGEMFDPALHQAVSETETNDTSKDHTIATVMQQGYKLGETVLRPARVSVCIVKK
jgi:molecular chaperone GrpE